MYSVLLFFMLTGDGGSGSLDYLIDARQRLAVKAEVIPSGGAQFARLLMSSELGMRSMDRSVSDISLKNLGRSLVIRQNPRLLVFSIFVRFNQASLFLFHVSQPVLALYSFPLEATTKRSVSLCEPICTAYLAEAGGFGELGVVTEEGFSLESFAGFGADVQTSAALRIGFPNDAEEGHPTKKKPGD